MSGPLTKEQLQDRLSHGHGQVGLLNLQVSAIDADKQEVIFLAPFRSEFERGKDSGQWHGGPVASAIDTAAVFALAQIRGKGAPTVNLRIDYLKPAKGDLTVTARARRIGRTVAVADVDVFDSSGALIALGRGTFSTSEG